MEFSVLAKPDFLINGEGRISLVLPTLRGEPEKPVLTAEGKDSLKFVRSAKDDCMLTEIPAETMDILKKQKKILVVETNVKKSIAFLQDALDKAAKGEDFGDDDMDFGFIDRAYEVSVEI